MNILRFGILLSAGAVLFFFVILVILLLLSRERNNSKRVEALSVEDPQTSARQATIAHMASKKRSTLDWPLARLKSNFKLIQIACADLNDSLRKKVDVPAPAEWLLDNFYIVESQYHVLLSELRRKEYLRLSRWKIYDNLRRSLLSPALLLLAVLAVFLLPGKAMVWFGFLLLTIMMPLMGTILSSALSVFRRNVRTRRYLPVVDSLKSALLQGLLEFTFLPYQAWLSLSAILLTLTRVWFTKKNLLEWVTSADSEAKPLATLGGYTRFMQAAIWQALTLSAMVVLSGQGIRSLLLLPLILLWGFSPAIAFAISRETSVTTEMDTASHEELEKTARKTWRYFEELSNEDTHDLAPDNYQLEPYRGVAARTSPTNIGFGLLATLTARDMGFIGTIELIRLVEKTIMTIERLPKWNGHLYNWYDTGTLKPLYPVYISTVDSGNLTGYLMTLAQGLEEYLERPLFDIGFFDGLFATVSCADTLAANKWRARIHLAKVSVAAEDIGSISGLRVMHDSLSDWLDQLDDASVEGDVWLEKTKHQMQLQQTALIDCFAAALQHLLFVEGHGVLRHGGTEYPYRKGDSFFIPAALGEYSIEGNSRMLLSHI